MTSIKIGQIIHNSNGYDYVVIEHKGSYTLLQRLNCSKINEPYIVAWCINEYESGWCWGQGYYFMSIDGALKLYNEKIK